MSRRVTWPLLFCFVSEAVEDFQGAEINRSKSKTNRILQKNLRIFFFFELGLRERRLGGRSPERKAAHQRKDVQHNWLVSRGHVTSRRAQRRKRAYWPFFSGVRSLSCRPKMSLRPAPWIIARALPAIVTLLPVLTLIPSRQFDSIGPPLTRSCTIFSRRVTRP